MSYKQEDLTKDLKQNVQELSVKMNLKLYELQRIHKRLNKALENGDFSAIRIHINEMESTMIQIEAWKNELEGFQRMGKVMLKHLQQ